MSLAQQVQGIVDNFLARKDETCVISEALYPPFERFDPSSVAGASAEWLETWGKMDLKHIFGFPAWEEAVFGHFTKHFSELKSVFINYAKGGTAGSASAGQALTMQSTELGNLALDIDILTEKFNMTRVINIFRRADQVDDTIRVSKANKGVNIGEDAKAVRPRTELRTVEQR
jgi:hypothetical protein